MGRRSAQRIAIEDVTVRRRGDPRVDPSLSPPRSELAIIAPTDNAIAASEARASEEARGSGLHFAVPPPEAAPPPAEAAPAAAPVAAPTPASEELRDAVHARVDLEMRLDRARRLAGELRGVFDVLERLEIELAEVRSDAMRVARALATELGSGDFERPAISMSAESERPTSIPEPIDVSELMRAVAHL